MLQLFLVPGLIVAFLVVAWLVGGWLFGVSYSKEQFLTRLKDPTSKCARARPNNWRKCCCATMPWPVTENSPGNWR